MRLDEVKKAALWYWLLLIINHVQRICNKTNTKNVRYLNKNKNKLRMYHDYVINTALKLFMFFKAIPVPLTTALNGSSAT